MGTLCSLIHPLSRELKKSVPWVSTPDDWGRNVKEGEVKPVQIGVPFWAIERNDRLSGGNPQTKKGLQPK
jgi:hypothetical protein